jgi:hypothetical protein
MFGRACEPGDAIAIIDYAQKVEPQGQKESQQECFGKAGISIFGATFLMDASGFPHSELVSMLGEEKAKSIKSGDFVVFTTVLYNADAHQDWLHSIVSFRACIELLLERFPRIQTLRLRSDGAGNFRCKEFVFSLPHLSFLTGVRIIEFSVSEAGGGKDLTDSLFMKQKQHLREGMTKKGGSARNAGECVSTVMQGEEEVGATGSCATREFAFDRPLSAAGAGVKKGGLQGISGIYHFAYQYTEGGVFEGMRYWLHEGIGRGKFLTATQCANMSSEDGGLTEEMRGELKQATSTLDEGNIAREMAVGGGARMVRGEEHKQADMDVRAAKKATAAEEKIQKTERVKDAMAVAVAASGLTFCQVCGKPFARQAYLRAHAEVCKEKLAEKEKNRLTAVLRPVSDIAQDQVCLFVCVLLFYFLSFFCLRVTLVGLWVTF